MGKFGFLFDYNRTGLAIVFAMTSPVLLYINGANKKELSAQSTYGRLKTGNG